MSAAHLNVAFVLEAPVETVDGAGGSRLAWAPLGQIWGRMQRRRGAAAAVAGTSVSRNIHEIMVRAAPVGAPSRPEPRQRLVLGARRFVLEAVYEADPSGRYLTCKAREETAQ